MRIQSAAVFAIAMVPVIAAGQQFLPNVGPPVDPETRFEVAAIKAFDQGSGQLLMRMTPGRFDATVPVGILLRQALQKPDYRIVGAPGWVHTERYSITAKAPEGSPPAAISVMLVNLLKDRFQLATHLETRELPIFNLVLTRSDGRLGPDLKPTSAKCQAIMAERIAAAASAAGRGGPPPPPPALPSMPGPNESLPCGFGRLMPGAVAISGRTLAQFVGGTLSDLARRPVIDKTGLTGMYDYALKFAPETAGVAGPLGLLPGPPPAAPDPDAPSVYTAVQEQLGLKLESARGPVEVVVIDKFEKPMLD
jgi:uncharacterized protein (TIGR03435 family)